MRNINSCYFGIRQSEYGKTYRDNSLPHCNSTCPVFDLKYVVDTLLQQQRELCTYQCLNNGSDDMVEALKVQIEAILPLLFHPPLNFNNRKYVISKFPYQSSEEAMTYCTAFGGYLAEVNDIDEYTALQNFVLNTPAVDIVLIAGSDAITEGTWRFQRTGGPVPILDWIPGQPDNLGEEDCLNLWKQYGGKMNDLPCGFRSSQDRFMCELLNLY
ncbi:mannose-binding protein C-like [Biomphalaria glabrata]|uniref:Mannose-binding protein C-like n=1 Tax=Biomphalaria glabrata TaxID=6526 RepID=A0A9W3BPP6_BIOGL|nr:mannose-binding protein C-like [Biomphalaria glabrata]